MRALLVVMGILLALIGWFMYYDDPARQITGVLWLLLIFIGLVVIFFGGKLMDYTPYIPEEDETEPQPKEETGLKTETSKDKHGKYCRYCGNLNRDDAVFCESCGKKIA